VNLIDLVNSYEIMNNRFARTCHLGSDGQPTCDCPPGYVGRRCEQCAAGYQGNPLIPGDMCIPLQECDPNGSLSPNVDPHTGKCHCKVLRHDDFYSACVFLYEVSWKSRVSARRSPMDKNFVYT